MITPRHRNMPRRSRLARARRPLSTTKSLPIATPLAGTCTLALTLALAAPAQADFLADSTASLEFKNYFITRDYLEGDRDNNKREEWAQGFLFRADSGFTEGPIGFGVDTISMLGVKLDSSPSRSGTGLLEIDDDGRAEDDYTKFGATAKIRAGESVLRYGYLEPRLPSLRPNASRLFTQSFLGTQITSTDIDGLELTAGQLNRTRQRDETEHEPMALNRKSGAYGRATSTRFQFVGGEYHLGKRARLGYHYAQLEDIYRQHYVGLSDGIDLGFGSAGRRHTLLRRQRTGRRRGRRGGQPSRQHAAALSAGRTHLQRWLSVPVRRHAFHLPERYQRLPVFSVPDQQFHRDRRASLARPLRLRLQRSRPARTDLHGSLCHGRPGQRQRLRRRGAGVGTGCRHRVHRPGRHARRVVAALAQRLTPRQLHPRRQREPHPARLHPEAVTAKPLDPAQGSSVTPSRNARSCRPRASSVSRKASMKRRAMGRCPAGGRMQA
ncbi:OprD family porin [Salinicola corii]|uniref:OprD family porin n=1 Tax=Salinicola corii TaxID=2606937 RepID=A0A640WFC0_9GAMM|nr:OprD family porin [Salinicola corii]